MESGRAECYCKKHSVTKCEIGWRVFAVVSATLSVLAIAFSLASFIQSRNAIDNGSIYERAALQPTITEPLQETYSAERMATFLYKEGHAPSRNPRRSRNKCNTDIDGTIPIAHIASKGAGPRTVQTAINEYVVLTSKWSCMPNTNAYIQGGMSYNSETGFLKVPVDGVYFVYSQLIINTTESLGHSTIFCSCTEPSDCKCLSDNAVTSSSKVKQFMSSTQPANNDFSSSYHGGVKYLTAGSRLALIPPLHYSGEYTYIAEQKQAYFGAFLISQLPVQEAVSSPSPSNTTSSD